MGSTFWLNVNIDFVDQLPDGWAIAQDLTDLLEAVLGSVWKESTLYFEATTESGISFSSKDIATLKERTADHRAPLSSVSGDLHYWGAEDQDGHLSANFFIAFDSDRASGAFLTFATPQRADIEAIQYALPSVFKSLSRRRRWKDATVKTRGPRITTSVYEPDVRPAMAVIKVTGLKSRVRRWIVTNRDNLIIGLGGGFVLSLLIIVLQMMHVIPIPQ